MRVTRVSFSTVPVWVTEWEARFARRVRKVAIPYLGRHLDENIRSLQVEIAFVRGSGGGCYLRFILHLAIKGYRGDLIEANFRVKLTRYAEFIPEIGLIPRPGRWYQRLDFSYDETGVGGVNYYDRPLTPAVVARELLQVVKEGINWRANLAGTYLGEAVLAK